MSRIIGWPSASQKMPAQAAMQFHRQSAVKSGAEMKASVSNAVAGKIWNTITLSPSQKAAAIPPETSNCFARIATEQKAT
jgi:hypothetical protein